MKIVPSHCCSWAAPCQPTQRAFCEQSRCLALGNDSFSTAIFYDMLSASVSYILADDAEIFMAIICIESLQQMMKGRFRTPSKLVLAALHIRI